MRRMDAPKSDAVVSSSDAMKMTPVRGFFGEFLPGGRGIVGKSAISANRAKKRLFLF